jgi:S-adenosylmethionine synthetase
MEIVIRPLAAAPALSGDVEIVERKGLGHPDTICDALAEQLSRNLCRFYEEVAGTVLHHNVDKALLWGGSSRPAFGGGEVLEPMEVFLAGRATVECNGARVPVEEMVVEGTRAWFRDNFHALDADKHVKVHCLVRPGSADLVELYERQRSTGVWLANDTSCGVGYAPLSELERMVLEVEARLNAREVKDGMPEIGQDIKVMGIRRGEEVRLTIACAFIGRFLSGLDDYLAKKKRVAGLAREAAGRVSSLAVTVDVNTADDAEKGAVYLTVTGTSAEAGDDGEAGRGNRANGLITPYRPMTMESVAGKNPITHVGKLYNLAAQVMTQALVDEIEEVAAVQCYLVSQIGKPVNEPQLVDVKVRAVEGAALEEIRPRVDAIAREHLAQMGTLWDRLLRGGLPLF